MLNNVNALVGGPELGALGGMALALGHYAVLGVRVWWRAQPKMRAGAEIYSSNVKTALRSAPRAMVVSGPHMAPHIAANGG
jgi:hypothetical protein